MATGTFNTKPTAPVPAPTSEKKDLKAPNLFGNAAAQGKSIFGVTAEGAQSGSPVMTTTSQGGFLSGAVATSASKPMAFGTDVKPNAPIGGVAGATGFGS